MTAKKGDLILSREFPVSSSITYTQNNLHGNSLGLLSYLLLSIPIYLLNYVYLSLHSKLLKFSSYPYVLDLSYNIATLTFVLIIVLL